MPIHRKNSRPDRFLNRFRYPPIVLCIKRANRYHPSIPHILSVPSYLVGTKCTPSTTGNRKFVLKRTPPYMGRRPVNPQQHQSRFPDAFSILFPNIGITILRSSDNAVGVGCPVDRCDLLIMLDCPIYYDLSGAVQDDKPRRESPRLSTRLLSLHICGRH
jgi:hypothetical protein